ncbi:MAG: putative oxidoreductase YdhV [Chloroflexi bacterium ADurb.Bin325]|nr:MAG: putative oxidoreductase YdhV [Chloroflexi bacterium ADurb.Bin325]
MLTPDTVSQLRQAHRTLAEYTYITPKVNRGYAGQTLYVDLATGHIEARPVTQQMKDIFVGGKGFGLWRLWHAVSGATQWNDPENELVIASGPLAGAILYPGTGKSLVVGISPLTNIVVDSNVGGYFAPLLKLAGWDALEVQGKAGEEVVIFIDGNEGRVTVEAAPAEAIDTHVLVEQMHALYSTGEGDKRNISVVSAGAGSAHTRIGCLNVSWYDPKRGKVRVKQAGRGGLGTVLRDKKIKAIVVRKAGLKADANDPADIKRIRTVGQRINKEIVELDDQQNRMRRVGTAHLVEIMDDYDLLPVHNFKFGSHPDTPRIDSKVWDGLFTQTHPDACIYGCTMACSKGVDGYRVRTGPYAGHVVTVDGPEYETVAGCGSNIGVFDPPDIIELNFYCDTYGVDSISFGTLTAFVMECYEAGILDLERTGGLDLRFGNAEAAIELLHQMARGEGFGLIAGMGVRAMKAYFVEHFNADPAFVQDIGMENKGMEYSEYMTKESLAQQGGYGMTNKGAQHDEAWLIFMDMVNNQIPTFEDKAEALHYFPMWRTWFGLNGLCKLPWNDIEPADNALTDEPAKVPEHVANYVELFSGTTGREVTKEDLITMSERVYNFQRVFNLKMSASVPGAGTRAHDAIPYRSVGPVTVEEYESRAERYDKQLRAKVGLDPTEMSTREKMAALRSYREAQYEGLIDAVYARRGWNSNGVPTVAKLRELGIDFPDVVALVEANS